LYRAALLQLAAQAGDEGSQAIWIDCAPDNAASIAGIGSAGFAAVARWSVQRIGPLRIFHAENRLIRIGGNELAVPLDRLTDGGSSAFMR
jgi:hypothetical protein